jgi:hypothetical protein
VIVSPTADAATTNHGAAGRPSEFMSSRIRHRCSANPAAYNDSMIGVKPGRRASVYTGIGTSSR